MLCMVLALATFAFMALLTTTASAAGRGKTFIVSGISMPKGAIPAANSGYSDYSNGGNPVSANGRYVVFQSSSDFQLPGVVPDRINVFRKDRSTGKIILISRASGAGGAGITSYTGFLSISGNGNLVSFTTGDKLDPADTDDNADVYIRNVSAATTTLVSSGTPENAYTGRLSADGRFIIFDTTSTVAGADANSSPDVFRQRLSDGTTELVSRIPGSDTAGDKSSYAGSISSDGRWVTFSSTSTDLVAGFTDNNGQYTNDVFVRDMDSGVTTLVSSNYASPTSGGNGGSEESVVAGTANSLADLEVSFSSYATDLAAPGVDDSGDSSVYLRNIGTPASELISISSSGENANSRAHTPSISSDGRRIVFTTDATNLGGPDNYYGVYLRNLDSTKTTLVSARNEYAVFGAISSDGKVAAWSESGTGKGIDPQVRGVFSRSLPAGKISLVSRPQGDAPFILPGAEVYSNQSNGSQLSQNGRFALIITSSYRLPGYRPDRAQAYRRDLKTGQWTLVTRANGRDGEPVPEGAYSASISNDGNRVVFLTNSSLNPADTDQNQDAYVRDISKGTTTLVSRADGASGVDSDESVGSSVISGDGKRVAFTTSATTLGVPGGDSQIYVRDLAAKTTTLVSRADGEAGSPGNGDSEDPDISDDGTTVSFVSYANNLSPDDPANIRSVYVRNLTGGKTVLVSRLPGLAGANSTLPQSEPAISGDGRFVAWRSEDGNLAPEAGPWPAGTYQIVMRNLVTGENSLISRGAGSGVPSDQSASDATLNRDGSVVAFESDSTNLISGLGGVNHDAIFVRNMTDGGTLSGPPAFGTEEDTPSTGAGYPSLSSNGRCVFFIASGSSPVSGIYNNLYSGYVFAAGGSCDAPPAGSGGPTITGASVRPARFSLRSKKGTRIRFRLDRKATVTFFVERKVPGRKVGSKCRKVRPNNKTNPKCTKLVYLGQFVRRNLPAGKNVVRFKARLGKKKLAPGKYRLRLRAADPAGNSKDVPASFVVVT